MWGWATLLLALSSTDLDSHELTLRAHESLGVAVKMGVQNESFQLRSGPAGLPVGIPWGTESA